MKRASYADIAGWIGQPVDVVEKVLVAAEQNADEDIHVRLARPRYGLPPAREGRIQIKRVMELTGLPREPVQQVLMAALLSHWYHAAGLPFRKSTGEAITPLDLNRSCAEVERLRDAGAFGPDHADVEIEVVLLKHLGWIE